MSPRTAVEEPIGDLLILAYVARNRNLGSFLGPSLGLELRGGSSWVSIYLTVASATVIEAPSAAGSYASLMRGNSPAGSIDSKSPAE